MHLFVEGYWLNKLKHLIRLWLPNTRAAMFMTKHPGSVLSKIKI